MHLRILLGTAVAACALAQDAPPAPREPQVYTVESGTRVLLSLINSVSTKNAGKGDRIYLQTSFPVLVDGRIVVPPSSYVSGTVTEVKRAGKVKGRAELYVRFDALTLPNGVTRDFRSRVGSIDGTSGAQVERAEGKIGGEGSKARDAQATASAAGWGAMVGGVASGAKGMAIGGAAGAAAGLIGVMMTRGSDVVLQSGSTVEMVLDRDLHFDATELDFGGTNPGRMAPSAPAAQGRSANPASLPRPRVRR